MADETTTEKEETTTPATPSIPALDGLRRIFRDANDTDALGLLNEVAKAVDDLLAAKADLEDKVVELEKKVAEGENEATKRAEESLLPVRVELEEQLTATEKQRDEFALALATSETQIAELTGTLNRLEQQRDEFDSMLRVEEAKRQQAETDAREALASAARHRLTALKAGDPAKRLAAEGEAGKPGLNSVRLRVHAWLGNNMARAELGLPPNVCSLCRSSPACYVDPRRPNPHGKILPADVLMFLRDLVTEALAQNKDPIAALDAWASGAEVEVSGLPDRPVPPAPPAPPPETPPAPEALGAQVAQG